MSPQETATGRLREEHRRILQVADVLERLVRRADESGEPDSEGLADCVAFIRLFADACHHGKEEELLFPELEARGMPRQMGPIAVMLQEHQIGREYARRMSAALDEMKEADEGHGEEGDEREGEESVWRSFRGAALGYVDLIRGHILKEDNVLFNMADRMVTGSACRDLCAAYGVVCAGHFEGHTKAELESLAADLVERYGAA